MVDTVVFADRTETVPTRVAADAVAAYLPVPFAVAAVRLIAGTPGTRPWRTVCEFPLAAQAR